MLLSMIFITYGKKPGGLTQIEENFSRTGKIYLDTQSDLTIFQGDRK